MKIESFIFFFLFISVTGLALPNQSQAQTQEQILLSPSDAKSILNAVQLEVSGMLITGEILNFSSQQQAALSLFRSSLKDSVFRFLPGFIATETIKFVIKVANLITKLPETTIKDFLQELEKKTVAEANKRAIEWLFGSGIKTGSGNIEYIYQNFDDIKVKANFQYIITYKSINPDRAKIVIEFYSPDLNDTPIFRGSISSMVGFMGDSPARGKTGPFIIRVETEIERIILGWRVPTSAQTTIEVEFPGEVPRLQLSKELPYPLEEQKIKLSNYWITINRIINFLKESRNETLENIGETATDIYTTVGSFLTFISQFASLGSGAVEQFIAQEPLLEDKPKQEPTDTEPVEATTQQEIKPPEFTEQPINIEPVETNLQKTEDPATETMSLEEIVQKLKEVQIELQRIETEIKNIEKETEDDPLEKDLIAQSCTISASLPQQDAVILNEIAWMGTSASATDEWIELKNISNVAIPMENWQLIDKDEQIRVVFQKQHIIPSNGLFILERTDDTTLPNIPADIIYKGALSNKNEALYLFDENCILRDKVIADSKWPAGESSLRKTMERTLNLNWQTSSMVGGTPEQKNSYGNIIISSSGGSSGSSVSQTYPKILITEIQALPIGERFVEIYNPTNQLVDLTGWYIQRKLESGNLTSFVSSPNFEGKTIQSKSYFLIARDTSSFSSDANILLNLTITEHNTIILKNPNQEVVDKVGFGENASDFEGTPAAYPEENESLGRIWNATNQSYNDSDNNTADFEIQTPTPKTKNEQQEPPPSQPSQPPVVSFEALESIQLSTYFALSWTTSSTNIDAFSLTYTVTPSTDGIFLQYEDAGSWLGWGQSGSNTLSFPLSTDVVSLSGQDGIMYIFSITAQDSAGNVSSPNITSTQITLAKTVVINEIAWMGTNASSSDEWIEFFNTSEQEIDFSGWSMFGANTGECLNFTDADNYEENGENLEFVISPNSYLVYANNENALYDSLGTTVADIWDATIGLNNSTPGKLQIFNQKDCTGKLIDEVDIKDSSWLAGRNKNVGTTGSPSWIRVSMERIVASDPGISTNWANNNLITHNGVDADSVFINGTPGQQNSVSVSNTNITSLRFDEFNSITLTSLGSPFTSNFLLSVPKGKTLIIEPGVTIKFFTSITPSSAGLEINGTLKAIGEEENSITFTALTKPYTWRGIYFAPNATAQSELNWVTIQYGKRRGGGPPSILIEESSPTIKNSTIENYDCNNCKGITLINSDAVIDNVKFYGGGLLEPNIGLDISYGKPTITNSYFENHKYGIFINLLTSTDLPLIENNLFEGNETPIYSTAPNFIAKNNTGNSTVINGIILKGNVSQNLTWFKNDMPYVIERVTNLTVLSTATLTIQDGVAIKMKPSTSFTVDGTLLAQGTDTNPITFTSLLNCSATPCPGYWKWLYFTPSSTGSILENTNVSFGGRNTGSIRIEGSSVQIDNVTSQYSSGAGLYLQNSTSTVQNSHFANNQFGMKIYGSAYPQLQEGMTFENNSIKDIFIDDCDFLPSIPNGIETNCL